MNGTSRPAFGDSEFQAKADAKRKARMDAVDLMPKDLRELVHEYGLNVVQQFRNQGVTEARNIRHLVECVLDEFSPTRGTFSAQGVRAPLIEMQKARP